MEYTYASGLSGGGNAMSELKTFNEIVIDWNDVSENVRKEVIKWVKELNKKDGSILIQNDLTGGPAIRLEDNRMYLRNIIYDPSDRFKVAFFLQYFFNTTEEEVQ